LNYDDDDASTIVFDIFAFGSEVSIMGICLVNSKEIDEIS